MDTACTNCPENGGPYLASVKLQYIWCEVGLT